MTLWKYKSCSCKVIEAQTIVSHILVFPSFYIHFHPLSLNKSCQNVTRCSVFPSFVRDLNFEHFWPLQQLYKPAVRSIWLVESGRTNRSTLKRACRSDQHTFPIRSASRCSWQMCLMNHVRTTWGSDRYRDADKGGFPSAQISHQIWDFVNLSFLIDHTARLSATCIFNLKWD